MSATKLYDTIIKAIAGVFAFIGFCLLCACIRWQLIMNDFLLVQGF